MRLSRMWRFMKIEDVNYRGYQVCLYYATTVWHNKILKRGLRKKEEWKVNFNRVKKTFYKWVTQTFFFSQKNFHEQLESRYMFVSSASPSWLDAPVWKSSVTGVYLAYPFRRLLRRLEFTIGLVRTVMQPCLNYLFYISHNTPSLPPII